MIYGAFARYGYDIIWQDNLDGLEDLSLDELVQEYNRIGYQLFDNVTNGEPITDGEELKEAFPPGTSEETP